VGDCFSLRPYLESERVRDKKERRFVGRPVKIGLQASAGTHSKTDRESVFVNPPVTEGGNRLTNPTSCMTGIGTRKRMVSG
jgi:hypothetical protein